MDISTLGIDLSKTIFHVIGFNTRGEIVLRRKFSRKQLLQFTANRQQLLIGMEACGSTHFLGRALQTQGHNARLIPAQFVKAFRKSNKNDYLDAEAIAEAVQRPTMRSVPIKTDDQLDLQALHKVRDRWVARRTAVMNQNPRLPHGARNHYTQRPLSSDDAVAGCTGRRQFASVSQTSALDSRTEA